MKSKSLFYLVFISFICMLMISCSGESGNTKSQPSNGSVPQKTIEKPLNISIFLDLSDRINRPMQPTQMARDTAIVGYLVDYFKSHTLGRKILSNTNKMKIFFYPQPQISKIATLAEDLSMDMEELPKTVERRKKVESMKETFQKNLDVIYQEALKAKQYPGCDIWDFFNSKKVDTYCIRKDYRNILIIITDGYLFATNHKIKEGSHGYSYILPQTLADTSSYLISTRTPNLTNLEVRILEVNPLDIKHRDKLVSTLEDWLKKMGVKEKNITVSETSLPTDTKTVIKSFLE